MGSRLESNSTAIRKKIENHTFDDEEGEEYEGSKFGGFPEYFRRKKIKLQNLDAELRAQASDKPQIFRGIVAHVNGYTQPSLNDLHRLIVSHGGGFMQYLDGKTTVTHIIASSLTPKKVVDFRKYRIVKPAWIVDSVNAGKLLPWNDYRVVDEGQGQKVLHFDQGKVVSEVNRKPAGYRDQTENSWYTSQLEQRQRKQDDLEKLEDPSGEAVDEPGDVEDQAIYCSSSEAETPEANKHGAEGQPQKGPLLGKQLNDSPQAPKLSETSESGPQRDDGALSDAESPGVRQGSVLGKRKSDSNLDSPRTKCAMTAEEHNAVLLADPRIRKSSVLNPEFLEQYYRESRLHHLSTWKADLKAQLQAITAEKTSSQNARQKRTPGSRRYILHVDFDSFFVAVSLKNHPQYQDKPAVVAHGSGSGSEIASCNYPARKYGVKNGMWMKRAQDMCPDLKVLPYDFPGYEAASKIFYDAIIESGGVVQSVSIDEALVDVTMLCLPAGGTNGTGVREGSIWREQEKANEIAQSIRDKVKEETGCAVSVGIGGNILLAKVALRKAKPAGQHQVKPEEVLDFVGNLEVQDLPGVAYSIGGKLEELGIKFVKDIRDISRERLASVLGPKTGEKIWNYSRGIDRTEVGDQVVRKSVSAEVNWGVRFETQEQAEEFVENLCGELNRRLLKENVRGKQLTMKIMRRSPDAPRDPPKHLGHGKCDTHNKSIVLGVATNAKEVLSREAISVLRGYGFSAGELRGLGVQMTKLESLKPVNNTEQVEGSQQRLQFKPTEPTKQSYETNASETAQEGSQKGPQFKNDPTSNARSLVHDPIQDDPETPRKHKEMQAAAYVPQHVDSPSRRPLNTLGTQFVLPTQVDPQVVAELPEDIRSRLAKHIKTPVDAYDSDKQIGDSSGGKPMAFTALPNQSQLDPQFLDSLPEDLRSEILAEYHGLPSRNQQRGYGRGQALLPQSPWRNRVTRVDNAVTKTRGISTRGRPRGGSLTARLRNVAASRGSKVVHVDRGAAANTLTQANFIARPAAGAGVDGLGNNGNDEEEGPSDHGPDQEFLAALPENIRREVMENHRREQLKTRAGLEVSRPRGGIGQQLGRRRPPDEATNNVNSRDADATDVEERNEHVLMLPPRPPKPTFTMNRLSKIEDLRDAISAWYEEFEEDGPFEEDIAALGSFLEAVVTGGHDDRISIRAGDMKKAVGVVKWLAWVVSQGQAEQSGSEMETREKWNEALESAKAAVVRAMKSRGLNNVDLTI
ncbi:MAG: deoxycytidyl transferase [Alyxoria varia]|nr:MAG: deoxycytidyl transferase [Alyxoria varia]